MILITTGNAYIDIDGLACVIALEELYKLQNIEVVSFFNTYPIHPTIPKIVENIIQGVKINTEFPKIDDYQLIEVDVSEPQYFPTPVDHNKIKKIYDHHFGFEEYWKSKIGPENALIKEIGACATLIFQEYQRLGLLDKISKLSANLLYAAIISNSLNFKAEVTKEEDIIAAKKLEKYIDLPKNFAELYFEQTSQNALSNPTKAIDSDRKIVNIHSKPILINQLELWNAKQFIQENLHLMETFLNDPNNNGFITIANIYVGSNFLVAIDKDVQKLLEETLKVKFEGTVAKTSRLYLRKELIRILNS